MMKLLFVDCTHIARAVIMWLNSMLLKVNSSYTADKGMGYEIRDSRLSLLAMLVRRPYPWPTMLSSNSWNTNAFSNSGSSNFSSCSVTIPFMAVVRVSQWKSKCPILTISLAAGVDYWICHQTSSLRQPPASPGWGCSWVSLPEEIQST